ncbi:MAG TPA: heavy metal-responsive transcriptional regulator [Trueperaceae bacterium]|nr:heavy metal-responsive transcriptional regulator [Trueperaceae bacterium]
MRIGELAARAGESVKTLRYWSELGLLETVRGDNGYRLYSEASASRVGFIRSAQRLGFTLGELASILAVRARGQRPCADALDKLQIHLDEVERRIAELEDLRGALTQRLAWARAHPDARCEDDCVYLAPPGPSPAAHP